VFRTYLLCLLLSFLLSSHPLWQQFIVPMWFVYVCYALWVANRSERPRVRYVWLAQVPGMIAAVASIASLKIGEMGEWGNGALEIWIHPFMPYLELLPPGVLWKCSDVYVVSCAIPFTIALISLMTWHAFHKISSRSALDAYPRK
jgi:hypothetical protein